MDEIFKLKKVVPKGIRFLGNWDEFKFSNFAPKCIIDKQSPGCGFTEYCINGPENVILCSPRKLLLKNKYDQHKDDVYLVVNEMEKDLEVDDDISKPKKERPVFIPEKTEEEKKLEKEQEEKSNQEIYTRIYNEIENYKNRRFSQFKPVKILVTYDSFHVVEDILIKLGLFDKFYIVIDEFQSILHDSRFKSTTEIKFLEKIKQSHSALFVSATPMLDKYMKMLPWFNSLPYYQLDWKTEDPTRIIKPDLNVSLMRSINSKASEIIQSYLNGNFESIVVTKDDKPTVITSLEAVLYVNSVNHIINIVKNNGLKPEQVNILCSKTDKNESRIRRRLGKKFNIGEIPLKGEPNKMFTICTRTVYLGADFYSKCARTFIFSDSNSDCLAVDISEDLPQILGRQRDEDNPWKNSANFYYKTTADYRKMTQADFDEKIKKKSEKTAKKLAAYNEITNQENKNSIAEDYQTLAKLICYKDDYIAVNNVLIYDNGIKKYVKVPVVNDLVKVNEIRAFFIQQFDYKDRFSLFATINEKINSEDSKINDNAINILEEFDKCNNLVDKMRLLCESGLSKDSVNFILSQIPDSDVVKSYYKALGPDKLRHLGYNLTYIKKELGIITFSPEILVNTIYSNFHVGENISLFDIKNRLTKIYNSINYKKTPKAMDIEGFFKVKNTVSYEKKPGGGRKQIRGYELLESYENQIREEYKIAK